MHTFTLTLKLTTSMTLPEAEDWARELVSDAHEHLFEQHGEALALESVR